MLNCIVLYCILLSECDWSCETFVHFKIVRLKDNYISLYSTSFHIFQPDIHLPGTIDLGNLSTL